MNDREQLAKDNGMTIEFVNWFFDNKKDGCGNVWFMMMAAMWEGWKVQESRCSWLAAERDALREGEMGDARHSNTRAAADIYFQLVEECEIPAGGSLVEYIDNMRDELEAAEKRIAELESREVVLPAAWWVKQGSQSLLAYEKGMLLDALTAAGIITKVGE